MRICFRLLFLLIAAGTAACSQGNTREVASSAADETAIRNLGTAYTAAVTAGDFQRVLSFYADDVVMMPPGQPTVRGKEAYAAWARPSFEQLSIEETISFDEIRVAGDWAVATYKWTLSSTPKTGGP